MDDTIRDLADALSRELSATPGPLDEVTLESLTLLAQQIEIRTDSEDNHSYRQSAIDLELTD